MEKKLHAGISTRFWMYDVPVSFDNGTEIVEFGFHRPDSGATFKESRTNYLLEFVLGGECTLGVSDKEYVMTKGQAFCVPPDTLHYYTENVSDPSKRFWISFDGTGAHKLVKTLPFDKQYILSFDDYDTLFDCIDLLFEARNGTPKSAMIIFSCFYRLLSVFFPTGEKMKTEQRDIQLVRDITRYIELNISNNISVDSLCRLFGYCRTALFEKFKNATGISIKEYIISKRIESAKYMLAETDMPVIEIAYSCGYADANALNKTFFRHEGESTASYRKNHSKLRN